MSITPLGALGAAVAGGVFIVLLYFWLTRKGSREWALIQLHDYLKTKGFSYLDAYDVKKLNHRGEWTGTVEYMTRDYSSHSAKFVVPTDGSAISIDDLD